MNDADALLDSFLFVGREEMIEAEVKPFGTLEIGACKKI